MVAWNIPGYVQGNRTAAGIECVQQAYILQFLFQCAWLAGSGEPAESRTAGPERPTGDGDIKDHQFPYHIFRIRDERCGVFISFLV